MKIAVVGTGIVGKVIAGKLNSLGHDVVMGTRDPSATLARSEPGMYGDPPVAAWIAENPGVRLATYAQAAQHAELVINATSGHGAMPALTAAGAQNLAGKVLIDISNPLDFSKGMPPTLFVCNEDSLGERIQRAFPATKVVKTLNTVNAMVMVDPARTGGGEHTMFVCGDDPAARATVTGFLKEQFGWRDVIDLGGIGNARGTEMLLPLWVRVWMATGDGTFGFRVVRS